MPATDRPAHTRPAALAERWTASNGEALRARRIASGLRQQDLAEAVGHPRTVLSNWETGSRAPSPAAKQALAEALGTSPEALGAAATPPKVRDDGWPGVLTAARQCVSADDAAVLLRFERQTHLFARLADNEMSAVRWSRLHAAAHGPRQELASLPTTAAEARAVLGQELAGIVRSHLGLGSGPLPALTVTAERAGIHTFSAWLAPGDRGRLRAVAVTKPSLGAAALVNAAQDDARRLHALAELLGLLLQQPEPVGALALSPAAGRRAPRSAYSGFVKAFAAELVLPAAACAAEAAQADAALARSRPDTDRAKFRAAVLTGLLVSYRAPAAVGLDRLAGPWRLTADGRAELLAQSAGVLSRAVARRHARLPAGLPDLPPRFLQLLAGEVDRQAATVQGAAELAAVDVSDLEDLLVQLRRPTTDDEGWLDAPGGAAAGPAVA